MKNVKGFEPFWDISDSEAKEFAKEMCETSKEETLGEVWVRRLEEGEEEITDKEIGERVKVFMRTVESMDKKQKEFLTNLSLKLNNLFKAGCNPGQLLQAFDLGIKRVLE